MIRTAFLTAFLALVLLLPHPALAAEPFVLTVGYLERPPYYWTDNGEPTGFLLDLTRRIMERAGVPVRFDAMPPSRILEEVRRNEYPFCSIGWFRNPERETFAAFSLPIYRDKPAVVLTTRDKAPLFSGHRTLESVFRDRSLIMAQVASFSYGAKIDRMHREILVRNMTVSTGQNVLPKLIAQGRATYMLIAPEEVSTLLASAGVDPDSFVELTMEDIPDGNMRYLMFNRNMPEDVLQRVNTAIEFLVNQKSMPLQPKP